MSLSAKNWINRGGELLSKDPKLAQRFINKGIKELPNEAICYFNLGIGLHQQGKIAAAIRAYEKCLSLPNPPVIEARNNLSQDLLLNGDWERGWKLYEHRFERRPGNFPIFHKEFGPRHFGQLIKNKPIILMSEQGLGDTIQFCRFGIDLERLGTPITLLSQSSLVELLRDGTKLKNVKEAIDIQEEKSNNPCWIPLMSIANILEIEKSNIPFSKGYIKANKELLYKWKVLLEKQNNNKLIALHWQGNPKHEKTLYSRGRSIDFDRFLNLSGIPNTEFISVQKGPGSEQLKLDSGLLFSKGQAAVNKSMDFKDTAAILGNCDLLITTDSSVAHLGGAMGIPTWLLLRRIPEWRWGLKGKTTNWYQSMQLYRQDNDGEWEKVINNIKEDLCEYI